MVLALSTARPNEAALVKAAAHAAQQRWIDAQGGTEGVMLVMVERKEEFFAAVAACNEEGALVGKAQYAAAVDARYAEAALICGKKMGECSKCMGTGSVGYLFANGICFQCSGLGWVKA